MKNIVRSIALSLVILAAAGAALPYGVAVAADTAGGVSMSMSNTDHLNILTNQYVIDYSRAASLRAKIKKAAEADQADATKRYEDASAKKQKSLDAILARMDELAAAGNYSDLGGYIDAINDGYPGKYPCFKPIFDKFEENIKFRMANSKDAETTASLTKLASSVATQREKYGKKPETAQADGNGAQAGDGGTVNSSTATDFSDDAASGTAADATGAAVKPEAGKAGAPNEKEKKETAEWTFMVYMNADNDLESAGIKDLNEMERVGSDAKMNILVQCDRSPEYDESNGNWVGARRFRIEKDNDFDRVSSKALAELGESVDMGDPAVLADFLKWGIKNYPAKRYVAVIWNHGSGWKYSNQRFSPVKGISYDESSGNHLDNFKLTEALAEAVKANGGRKLDIVTMDACLMAMLEVAYQIKDTADIYVASEEVAPGDGMPYDLILAKLAEKPAMDARELSQIMVENDIRSYKGGSQGWANCTFSAVDLSNIDELASRVDALAKHLLQNYDRFSYAILATRLRVLKYSDADYADLADFCKLLQNYAKDQAVSKLCDDVIDAIGRPDTRGGYFETFNAPVVITAEKAGKIRWTINDRALPPAEYMPKGTKLSADSASAETPLAADGKNGYRAAVGPFNGAVQVNSLNYTVFYADGSSGTEKTVSSSNSFFTRPVPGAGGIKPAVIAEGHSQALAASRGISIYLTPFEDYLLGYKNLDFSRKYGWSQFISYKPKFTTTSRILLVPDTGYVSSDLLYSKFYNLALNQSKFAYDLYLPAIYGELEEDVLNRYKDGVVIWFTAKNPNCISKYEESILERFVSGGGCLFISGQNIEQHHGLSRFFTDCLGALYVEDTRAKKVASAWDRMKGASLDLGGDDSANNVSDPSVFNLAGDKAKTIFTYADGKNAIAGIKNGGVVFLGFGFESVASGDMRSNLMKNIVDDLMPAEGKIDLKDKF